MKHNILDIKGIKVGHAQNQEGKTGVTVVIATNGAVCGVDVRGAAPGTRETDLLNPINAMEKVNAVVLSGGSAFGLEASCGVMKYLEEKGMGFDVGVTNVPIIPGAVLYDLENGDAFCRPDQEMGRQACENASDESLAEGDVGAGCGATVGKLRGTAGWCNSGIGSWAETTENGITVAALIAVNAFGDVLENGKIIAGTRDENGNFLDTAQGIINHASTLSFRGKNTTIGVIATNVKLTKAQGAKVAGMAHDGLARCISPVHTTMDGDTLFCLSTEEIILPTAPVDLVGILAAKVTEQAVLRGVKAAKPF
ncbi:peptidase family S58 [Anaerotignum neopropionicum]|uniref:Peptidase family S58 n=1 Tax=Anaerotignum neopropionicum TaxID=36847 RepID=A0A136WEM2_9FIRM|nr:P1 family peptidase [Anaerotignum neopropionicum]KXL52799.1 peptidase family S58 [Anaerotignum neopropionicum]